MRRILVSVIALVAILGASQFAFAPEVIEVRPSEPSAFDHPIETPEQRAWEAQQQAEALKAARARAEQEKEVQEAAEKAARTHFGPVLGDAPYSVLDAVSDPNERVVLKEQLEKDPNARKVDLLHWQLVALPTLDDIYSLLALVGTSLPGKVNLGVFLDDIVFGDAVAGIKSSWQGRQFTALPQSSLLLDGFLKSLAGQTLFAVGHVDGGDFLQQRSDGTSARLPLQELMEKSLEYGVFLVPIGCRTAASAMPVGFLKEIDTDAVARFLRDIPKEAPTYADVFSGMREIGDNRYNLRDILNQLEIEVVDPDTGDQITHVKIRYPTGAAPGPVLGASTPQQLQAAIAEAGDELRPWWDRKWLRDRPWIWLLAWAAFVAATYFASEHFKTGPANNGAGKVLVWALSAPLVLSIVGVAAGVCVAVLWIAVTAPIIPILGIVALVLGSLSKGGTK